MRAATANSVPIETRTTYQDNYQCKQDQNQIQLEVNVYNTY
jgi:hypothetical protein